jgi:arsenate reductase-like glutaredoxin family protein
LRSAGHELTEVNYASGKATLDEATVKALVEKAGSVSAVMNTRHAIVKENGWAAKPPDAATFAKAVVKEPNLLRRPILDTGKKLIVGFDKAAYAKLT